MKIVHVPRRFTRVAWGGTEEVIAALAARQRQAGHDASIATASALDPRRAEIIDSVPVRRYPYVYPYLGLNDDARRQLDRVGGNVFSFELWRALAQEPGLDLLHVHTGKRLGGICRHVARQRNIPYVVTLHGGVANVPAEESARLVQPAADAFEWGRVLGWWVGSRRVLADADAVVCLNREEADALRRRYPGSRIEIIGNGVDPEIGWSGNGAAFRTAHNIPTEAFLLLSVARIDPQKNQLALLDALSKLRSTGVPAHLALIGPPTDDVYAQAVQERARRDDLRDAVTVIPGLPPRSPELLGAFGAADVFVLPSLHEPFGIAVLEAWAAGIPVVTTSAGGLADFVTDRVNALVTEAKPGPIATAVGRLFGDEALGTRLRRAGRSAVNEIHSWDTVSGRYQQLYEDLLASRRRVPA
jgi:glycosyltransferase involved in cell wall biosynthesis